MTDKVFGVQARSTLAAKKQKDKRSHSALHGAQSYDKEPIGAVGKGKLQQDKAEASEAFESDTEASLQGDCAKEFEPAHRKRLKQAKAYIQELEGKMNAGNDHNGMDVDAADIDRELIADRLQKDALSAQGRLFVALADKFCHMAQGCVATPLRPHAKPVTCAVFSADNKFIYSASKDGTIQQWNVDESKKGLSFTVPTARLGAPARTGRQGKVAQHRPVFYALAVSPSHEYLVAGGRDRLIHVWRVRDGCYLKALKHHRDIVTGLVFRQPVSAGAGEAETLFSCSHDRTVKIWSVEGFAYVDTLFGHQDGVVGIDALSRDRCVTVGARDRTARLWKIAEASQLIFKADDTEGALDSLALLDEEHFVTGSEAGTLAVWHLGRKRPMAELNAAHGAGRAIASIAALKYTDLFATGSSDGCVRLWKVDSGFKSIVALAVVPIEGWINHLSFNWTTAPSHISLAASVGQEPRLGRWQVIKGAKNRVYHVTWSAPKCP